MYAIRISERMVRCVLIASITDVQSVHGFRQLDRNLQL